MGMTADGLSYWQAESEGIDLLEMTIGDLLDRRADELPTQEAIVYSCYPEFGDALTIRWTYQDYRDRANAVAKGLLALGLAKGDHIAVWAANLPEWPICMMGMPPTGLWQQEGWRPALLDEVAASGPQVSEAALAARQAAVTPLEPAMLLYTLGQNRFPKGGVVTHPRLVN